MSRNNYDTKQVRSAKPRGVRECCRRLSGQIREDLANKYYLNRDLESKQNLDTEEQVMKEILGPL